MHWNRAPERASDNFVRDTFDAFAGSRRLPRRACARAADHACNCSAPRARRARLPPQPAAAAPPPRPPVHAARARSRLTPPPLRSSTWCYDTNATGSSGLLASIAASSRNAVYFPSMSLMMPVNSETVAASLCTRKWSTLTSFERLDLLGAPPAALRTG
jgi:hypothetical protein